MRLLPKDRRHRLALLTLLLGAGGAQANPYDCLIEPNQIVELRSPVEGVIHSVLVKRGDQYRTVSIGYFGGNRYPVLERAGAAPGWLDALLAPKR